MTRYSLYDFVEESNRIEGITRDPREMEITAHEILLAAPTLTILLLKAFVATVQPGAILRDRENLNVRVGRHVAPQGGAYVTKQLDILLSQAYRMPLIEMPSDDNWAFLTHRRYEHLHPFTDGNGRSGRAVWLWMMGGIERAPLGFLHTWYYQSLNA